MVFFDAFFSDDRRTEPNIANPCATSRALKEGLVKNLVFWVLPPEEAFFWPFKARNLVISVVAALGFPIKAVGNVLTICATS